VLFRCCGIYLTHLQTAECIGERILIIDQYLMKLYSINWFLVSFSVTQNHVTLNDLEWPYSLNSVFAQVRLEFVLGFLKTIALKLTKVDQDCQQQKCLAWTLHGDIQSTRIFAGVLPVSI